LSIAVPVIRGAGSRLFTVPKFVEDPEDLRGIAVVVIGAFEKWGRCRGWVADALIAGHRRRF
jgi:hypothetical protein